MFATSRNIFWVLRNCVEIWKSQPPGKPRAYPGLHRNCFTIILLATKLVSKYAST
jgi:hypothetical protein